MNLINEFQAVLFDLDGTLIDSMPTNYLAWSIALIKYDLTIDKQWFFENEGRNIRELIGGLLDKHMISREIIDELISLKEKNFIELYKFKPYEGAEILIKELKKRGSKLGLVTAGLERRLRSTMPDTFLKNFDVVVTGGDTICGKPSPEPYLYALEKMRVKKQDALVIENAPLGIDSAKNAGIRCIGIASTMPAVTLSHADIVVGNISEVHKLILGN